MPSTPASLILATTSRLPLWMVEPFSVSLRATGYRGQLGLIVGEYSNAEAAALEELADFTVQVAGRFPPPPPFLTRVLEFARTTRGLRRTYPALFHASTLASRERSQLAWWERLEYRLEGLQALRYGIYYEALQRIAPWAEAVFLTDIRDVVFQRDPFETSPERLELFLEDPSRTIGAEPHNRRWIARLFGEEALADLAANVVSCSGTVIGPRDEILHYLSEMSRALTWRRLPMGSHDQGVHNFLLRTGRFGSPEVVENGHGRVLTMGGMKDPVLEEDGVVRNVDGTVPPVLHQYDRHPALARSLTASLKLAPAQSGTSARTAARSDSR